MKRILAVTLTLVMLLATLTGCMASKNPSGSEGEQPKQAQCLSEENGVYKLTLPKSKEVIELYEEQVRFVPYITDALVEVAENKITEDVSQHSNRSNFFLQITNDYLCLVVEIIKSIDPPVSAEEGEIADGGCGIDHEHLFFSERISSKAVADNKELHFGTSDEDYGKIQFFPQPTLEFTEEDSYDTTVLEWTRLTDGDMDLLRQVYNDGKGWIDDSVVDRVPFYFDGRIRFATMDSCGWMYFGIDQNVLYYNGMFTQINSKVLYIIEKAQNTISGSDNSSQENDYLVNHIQISSGNKTIYPFGCMTWSKIDNGNGTFSESIVDKYDVIDLVSGKTPFAITDIPKLVLNDKVSYFVQVNGRVEKVYLLTPNDDTYIKSETTFDALSNLADGTYYVVLEVLLSGNCDPDAPQNSYRYEDVFCLVVREDNEPVNITYSSGDVLSQRILNNAEKQIILNILDSENEWISNIPDCDWICRFSGSVNIGYCDCGTLSDIGNNRSRKLTDAEKENIESLISQLNEEELPSGYEVEVELFQYTWDGWGISQKTVGACDVAYNIIDALKAMKETGETVPKISDEVFEIGGGQYAAERGTMWIESGNKIYRLTPDLSQICLVETHFGEGKVLEITDAFKTNVNNAWHYAPYDYYKGTYNKGDYTVDLESVFKSGSTVQLSIKKIQIESGYDPKNTITVELISSVDQEVNIKLHCQQSDDNLAVGDYRTVQLKKGEPTTVDLTFGGWPNFTYWVYIEADFTKAEITINP